MSVPSLSINPYDEVHFPSQPLAQSTPHHLAAVARLFDLATPDPRQCRVLELGCATGGNIIPMADRFRQSQFVGIDYSQAQVLLAQRTAAQLELTNLELRHADIAELDQSLGQFDYIICHGVYSWVSRELQDKILELCRTLLVPSGVAYISYNTYPGWHMRFLLRHMMCRLATSDLSPKARCAKGRATLEFLVQASGRIDTPYAKMLKAEAEGILKMPDGYIYHEYFESDNRPLYFHEFVRDLSRFELQFLGEASPATMFASNFGEKVESHLSGLSSDLVGGEQHLDILRGRGFRQSLVCHASVSLSRHLTPRHVEGLYFYGRVAPVNPQVDLRSRAAETFRAPNGMTITSQAPALKATLYFLHQQWPRGYTVDQLLHEAARLLGQDNSTQLPPEARDGLSQNLIKCLVTGLLDINGCADDFVSQVSERPQASALARLEALRGGRITNLRHESIDIDDATRGILPLLDGRRDRQQLLAEMMQAFKRGDLSMLVGGLPATQPERVASAIQETLDTSLATLAAKCLLIA